MDKFKQIKSDAKKPNFPEECNLKMHAFGNCIDENADELFKKVKKNPLLSLLVAGGLGYILAKIL